MMQNKPKHLRSSIDARLPLLFCVAIGVLFLAALAILCSIEAQGSDFFWDIMILLGVYLLLGVTIFAVYCFRQSVQRQRQRIEDAMNTGVYDVFKYVIDLPYAIVDTAGTVKVMNRALQEILELKSPLSNAPLSTFCSIPIQDILRVASEPSEARFQKALTPQGEINPASHSFHIRLKDRRYELYPYEMHLHGQDYCFIVFNDISDYLDLREKVQRECPVVAYIVLDNLQELTQYVRVSYRVAANEVENVLKEWAKEIHGLLQEYDKDKYLLICSEQALEGCIENNFQILNKVRKIDLADNVFPMTISMGISTVGDSFSEKESLASAALDIALQRGGDQVALRNAEGVSFFGGRVKTMQNNTSIISRVNSIQLCARALEAGNIIIMGHRNPDFDAIGACVGVARLMMSVVEKKKTDVRIIMDKECDDFKICADFLGNKTLYDNLFIDAYSGLDLVRSDTLLIIVDANNVNILEAPDVVRNVANIAIIDHHRQYDAFDFTPVLSHIHPSASSTCELIVEMLEQSPYSLVLRKEEATLLLAGIMLDTKNFTHSTSTKTFAAAQYLYDQGAHTNLARLFFYDTLEDYRTASDFGAKTFIYRGCIAITYFNPYQVFPEGINKRIAAAKAADRLLTIRGVEASFALVSFDDAVSISARSGDAINVQIIMEKMGGGGHFDMAGAQVKNTPLAKVLEWLKAAIDEYLEHEVDHKYTET